MLFVLNILIVTTRLLINIETVQVVARRASRDLVEHLSLLSLEDLSACPVLLDLLEALVVEEDTGLLFCKILVQIAGEFLEVLFY